MFRYFEWCITFPQLPHLPVSNQLPTLWLSPLELKDTALATIINDLLGIHFSSTIFLSILKLSWLGFSDTKFPGLLYWRQLLHSLLPLHIHWDPEFLSGTLVSHIPCSPLVETIGSTWGRSPHLSTFLSWVSSSNEYRAAPLLPPWTQHVQNQTKPGKSGLTFPTSLIAGITSYFLHVTGTSINSFPSHKLRFQPWFFFLLLSDIEILSILFSKYLLITYILSPISVTALSPLLESQQPPSPACFQSCLLPFAPRSPIPQCHLSQNRPRFSQNTSILSQTTPSLASL